MKHKDKVQRLARMSVDFNNRKQRITYEIYSIYNNKFTK